MIRWDDWRQQLNGFYPYRLLGRVTRIIGLTIESQGPKVQIGELCHIHREDGVLVPAEVVGFRDDSVLLMPLGPSEGLASGATVESTGQPLDVAVGDQLLGRVLNGLGEPMDDEPLLPSAVRYPLIAEAPHPLNRPRITNVLSTGVRALDAMLTVGVGQRLGLFAGSGVGKSTLLGMIARNSRADVNVIGLIGERGREVREFIERDLGQEGMQRSVVVAATSEQPALVRLKGAFVATAIAEFFRDQGKSVLLMLDSLTRFAMAQREVGLAIGEPPSSRGYTPSVFSLLPRLLERSGQAEKGSMTAFYTVLVDGDDMNEPITDAVRGILDGHIVLTRDLANRGHYPAIDALASISRLFPELASAGQQDAVRQVRRLLAVYRENQDLINIGAYKPGGNPDIDEAISRLPAINAVLQQAATEESNYETAVAALKQAVRG